MILKRSRFFFRGLFWGLLLLLPPGIAQTLHAQNPVDIIKADKIKGGTYEGERVQKIINNVHLRGENLEMFCDSAYKFVKKSEIKGFGNIQINTKDEKIWADSLTYFTDVDFSQLRGRVIIQTDSSTLFGNSVDYRFSNKVAHFIDKIRLEDDRGTLLANSGYYYRKADSAEFFGNVQLRDSLKYLEGDSLFSNRSTNYYEIHGNVFGDDPKNKSTIKGDYLESDSTGRRLLKGNAWLKTYKKDSSAADSIQADSLHNDTLKPTSEDSNAVTASDSLASFFNDSLAAESDSLASAGKDSTDESDPDTTHIRADYILSVENQTPTDTSSVVFADKNVRVWSPSFSAISDSAKYADSTETFELWKQAKAWNKEIQLSGPYIYAKLNNGNLDSLKSYPSPFSVMQDTVIERLNQITGDTLFANFKNGAVRGIKVYRNAHLLYFTKNDADSADGAIEVKADTVQILFKKGKIDSMRALNKPTGSYLPKNEQTASKKLQGFVWSPDLRPKRPEEKMKRRLPPIPQKVFFELPKRYIKFLKANDPQNPKLKGQGNDKSEKPPQKKNSADGNHPSAADSTKKS